MENLDEIIITKSKKGLEYLNKKGFEIFNEIQFQLLYKYLNE